MSWIGENRALSAIDWIEQNKPHDGDFIVYYKNEHWTATLDINESQMKNIRWKMYFKDGNRADGPSYGYYCGGQIKQIINWKDNKMHGHLIRFYPNGMITDMNYYENGLEHGYWYHLLEDGRMINEGEFHYGERLWKKQHLDLNGKTC